MRRIAFLTMVFLAAPAFGAAPGTMTVSYLEGEATASERPLKEGDSLLQGETVQTGGGARLEISIENGSVIRLGERSRLLLGVAPADGHAFSARLFLGNLWTKVHKLVSSETFQVETENGVAGVRGTEFRVEAGPEGDVLRVYEGAVEVKGAAGWDHRVEPGKELTFHRDRAPAGPRPFDPNSEKGHRFMQWVRERPHRGAAEPGRVKAQAPAHERRDPERREKHHGRVK